MFLLLLHTALRESELLSLDYPDQLSGGYLLNIQRKVTRKLCVPKLARMQPLSDPKPHLYPTIEEGGTKSCPAMELANQTKTATCELPQGAV
ncbi:hypothetical protein V202x_30390 [Gimesia aquarii]|uniref:Phage integrase family protein n=2 Tax=Gimesia aquarii TaxID=2527964 RepID=A0A517WWL2_9PLAN|nr:hypothetical protein V202x_30390 [Gimesia aquarii]